jgi:hypothetical protein
MARRNWLQAQIREADSDVQRWPEWMKKVATFDGRRREDAIGPSAANRQIRDEQPRPSRRPNARTLGG